MVSLYLKYILLKKLFIGAIALSFFACTNQTKTILAEVDQTTPHDFMFMQRAYPSGQLNTSAFREAVQWKKKNSSQEKAVSELWEFVGQQQHCWAITNRKTKNLSSNGSIEKYRLKSCLPRAVAGTNN